MIKKYFLFFIAAGSFLFIAGCAKDFSAAVDQSDANVTVTYIRPVPSAVSIKDSAILFIAKASKPKRVGSLRVNIYSDGNLQSSVILYDNGSNGDSTANDSLFSALFPLKSTLANGSYTIQYVLYPIESNPFVCAEQRFTFFNGINSPPSISNLSAPDTLVVNGTISFSLSIKATDPDGGTDILNVFFVVTAIPIGTPTGTIRLLKDEGGPPDSLANDGIYTAGFSVDPTTPKGTYTFEFHAKDRSGAYSTPLIHNITLK